MEIEQNEDKSRDEEDLVNKVVGEAGGGCGGCWTQDDQGRTGQRVSKRAGVCVRV